MVLVVLTSGVATGVAVLISAKSAVERQTERELVVAKSVFDQLVAQRFTQLSDSVTVLAADFGFRQAAATGDEPTIASVLENHSVRVGADLSVLIDLDGNLLARSGEAPGLGSGPDWRELVTQLRRDDFIQSVSAIDERPYQLVAVPVMAPEKISWLMMGFAIDDELVSELKAITGLDLTFFGPSNAGYPVAATTLDAAHGNQLQSAVERLANVGNTQLQSLALAEEDFLALVEVFGADPARLLAVLQLSLTEAFAPYERLKLQLLSIFAAILTVAVAIGVRVARGLTGPIERLSEAARRIGEGDYAVHFDVEGQDEVGRLGRTLTFMRTEIAERERRIVYQSHHDELTGLANRYLAADRLGQSIARARRDGDECCVALLDLNRFKAINDSLGHPVGDQVLRKLAFRLESTIRSGDTTARLGGDDFLIVFDSLDPEACARLLRRDILPVLSQPVEVGDMHVQMSVSVGVAAFPRHGKDADELIRRAEIAMYEAKGSQEVLKLYEAGSDEGHLRQLAIVADLPRALENGELRVHYQPQAAMRDGAELHAEALARWVHPKFGNVSPEEFIGVLERSGNIGQLTAWLLDTVGAQAARWREAGFDVQVSVNLSALDVMSPELTGLVGRCLTRHNLRPSNLALEVTESAIMSDPVHAIARLGELRATGHRIAIDDFGTGYSSLGQLRQLPVDELKIDKSFVMHLSEGSEDALIVRSTIDLAHALGLEVVAEGVETEQAWDFLDALDCERVQGYYLSKPLTAEQYTRRLERCNDTMEDDESNAVARI